MSTKEFYEKVYSNNGENLPYHMFNSITYVEVKEPYYALIKSKGTVGWIDRYEEDVCKIDSRSQHNIDKMKASNAKSVYEDYAFTKFLNAKYPNLTHEEYLKAMGEFKDLPVDSIIVLDGGLK